MWANFRSWIISYTPTVNNKGLIKDYKSCSAGKVSLLAISTSNCVITTAKTIITAPYHQCMWVTCDICHWGDRYCVRGAQLVSIMLLLCQSSSYDHYCDCQWVLPDTPGAWPAWRWWWESSWPVWWWWSPPRSLNAHTPDQERTKDDGLLLSWLNPIGTSHEAAQLIHRACLHFGLARIIFSIHFIFLHDLSVIQWIWAGILSSRINAHFCSLPCQIYK